MNQRATEVVFLTSFNESCVRAIPALTRMASDLATRLTLLHAFDPRKESRDAAEARLASFFPEADRFTDTRRVVLQGPLTTAVRQHAERRHVDLFIAPGFDRARPLRFGSSTRAELVSVSPAPVWTLGQRVPSANLLRPVRRIACWLDPEDKDATYLRLSADLARKLGGELHILHVAPEFYEGAYLSPSTPLHAGEVAASVTGQLEADIPMKIHVAPGGNPAAVLDLAQACEPDLLVVSPRRSVRQRLLGLRLSRLVDRASCPVLCVGEMAQVPRVLPGRGLLNLQARAHLAGAAMEHDADS